jgi:hypothetical protein
MPAKSEESKPAIKELAAFLAEGAAKVPLDDPLASSKEKQEGLTQLLREVYRQLPPRLWSPQQFDEFVDFLVVAAVKANSNYCFVPAVPPVAGSGAWSPGHGDLNSVDADGLRKLVGSFPGGQWLLSAPSPEDFIARATHLQSKEPRPEIDYWTRADDLKMWLKSVGCKDVEKCRAFLRKTKEAGVRLAGLDQLRIELGE